MHSSQFACYHNMSMPNQLFHSSPFTGYFSARNCKRKKCQPTAACESSIANKLRLCSWNDNLILSMECLHKYNNLIYRFICNIFMESVWRVPIRQFDLSPLKKELCGTPFWNLLHPPKRKFRELLCIEFEWNILFFLLYYECFTL